MFLSAALYRSKRTRSKYISWINYVGLYVILKRLLGLLWQYIQVWKFLLFGLLSQLWPYVWYQGWEINLCFSSEYIFNILINLFGTSFLMGISVFIYNCVFSVILKNELQIPIPWGTICISHSLLYLLCWFCSATTDETWS